jgi:hypothetical protein
VVRLLKKLSSMERLEDLNRQDHVTSSHMTNSLLSKFSTNRSEKARASRVSYGHERQQKQQNTLSGGYPSSVSQLCQPRIQHRSCWSRLWLWVIARTSRNGSSW